MTNLPKNQSTDPGRWIDLLLNRPDLLQRVQAMSTDSLLALIVKNGLEDSGELIALATTTQLAGLLDEDLWRSPTPGKEEMFDSARFGLWLEVLHEIGPALAAQKILELDPLFVVMAMSTQLLVLNTRYLETLVMNAESGEEYQIEKAIESRLNHEFGEYIAVAKADQAWDALLAILVELENHHQDYFERVMAHLARLSSDSISSANDLQSQLSLAAQLENDIKDEREQRRGQKGYVAPLPAANWLQTIRTQELKKLLTAPMPDETKRYFENLASRTLHQAETTRWGLKEAWLKALPPETNAPLRSKPKSIKPAQAQKPWPIHLALQGLAHADPQLHALRSQELVYLANILMAGCAFQNRAFRHVEAAQAAIAVCNLGLEYWLTQPEAVQCPLEEQLARHSAINLFRAGYSMLHHVAEMAAQKLIALLSNISLPPKSPKGTPWLKKQLESLRIALEKSLQKRQPWLAADQLLLLETVLESHQVAKWIALISEFPLWPGRYADRPELIHSLKALHNIEKEIGKGFS